MERLYLEGNERLPRVILDKQSEIFEISGISNDKDINRYYEPVFNWIDRYIKEPLQKTTVNFNIKYYSPESSFLLFKIMQKLQYLRDYGNEVSGKWHYDEDDESIFETGRDLQDIFIMDIDLIKRPSEYSYS